ncbi:hypothetical protein PIB30_067457 [Stylosanthes scabra]|uniref:Uncharacterized protein n=1 Tax=Stylosanthes scabra TaxID=79078 RepID=A0ABU6QMH7_9FABA|nr:hypothetical protein [Stylosanthes scabra]
MTVGTDSVGRRGMGHDDRIRFLSWEWFMVLDRFNLLKWIGLASTGYWFYRTQVIVRPVGSTKSCRPKAKFRLHNATPANGSRLGYHYATCSSLGTWPLWTGSTTFDRSEPYLGSSLSSRGCGK